MKNRLVKLLLEQIHLYVPESHVLQFMCSCFTRDRVGEGVNETMAQDVIMSFVNVYQYRRVNQLKVEEHERQRLVRTFDRVVAAL